MAGTTGLEPATSAVTGQRSNQLSYAPAMLHQSTLQHSMPPQYAKAPRTTGAGDFGAKTGQVASFV